MSKALWHKHPAVRTGDQLSFGERAADRARNGMGSWVFIWAQTLVVLLWVILNVVAFVRHWDPYPFILLNLAFSTQAAYAAPLILLSQKRSDQVSCEVATHTYENTELIKTLIRQDTELTSSVRDLVKEIRAL